MSIKKITVDECFLQRIEKLIEINELNRSSFAKKLKVTPSAITELLKGRSKPSAQLINSICREFCVSEDWLTKGEGEIHVHEPTHLPYGDLPQLTEKEQALLDFIRKFSAEEQDKMIKEIKEKAIKALTGEN